MAWLQGKSDAPRAKRPGPRKGVLAFLPEPCARIQSVEQFFRRDERCGGDGLPEGRADRPPPHLENGNRERHDAAGYACFRHSCRSIRSVRRRRESGKEGKRGSATDPQRGSKCTRN